MAAEDELESRRMVRMYSFDVEERLPPGSNAYVLGQALEQEVGVHVSGRDLESVTAPWRRFYEAWEPGENDKNPITEIIAVESAKLREKWVTFQNSCPKDERLDTAKSEPTIEGVVDMVKEVNRAWEARRKSGRRGRVMALFHKFCGTLDAHSSMLEVLPEGSEYVSLFTGTLNAVIRASVNHERIAEGISEGLCAISEHVVECRAATELFHTPSMLQLVADLYAHVFLFLSGVMDWVMEKRFKKLLDSFNENFLKSFDDQIAKIRGKAEFIRSLAAAGSHAEVRVARLTAEETRVDLAELGRDVRAGLTGEARHRAEMRYFAEKFERELSDARRDREEQRQNMKQLGSFVKMLLQEGAIEWIGGNRDVAAAVEAQTGRLLPSQPAVILSRSPALTSEWIAWDVSINSKCLEDFFHRDRVRLSSDPFKPVMASPETVLRLGEWAETGSSGILWIDGPTSTQADDFENPITILAAKFIDLSDQAHVAVMSYFCELRRGELIRDGNTREDQAMVALVYSLIRQMVELLLPRFDSDIDLSESRFRRLDGTVASWQEALSLFRDLLTLMPETVFCVVDGFHWLDDRSTNAPLKELIQLLRAKQLKALFTTTGRSGCLRQELSNSERLLVANFQQKGAVGLNHGEIWPRS